MASLFLSGREIPVVGRKATAMGNAAWLLGQVVHGIRTQNDGPWARTGLHKSAVSVKQTVIIKSLIMKICIT
jgi:hypothetical protein